MIQPVKVNAIRSTGKEEKRGYEEKTRKKRMRTVDESISS